MGCFVEVHLQHAGRNRRRARPRVGSHPIPACSSSGLVSCFLGFVSLHPACTEHDSNVAKNRRNANGPRRRAIRPMDGALVSFLGTAILARAQVSGRGSLASDPNVSYKPDERLSANGCGINRHPAPRSETIAFPIPSFRIQHGNEGRRRYVAGERTESGSFGAERRTNRRAQKQRKTTRNPRSSTFIPAGDQRESLEDPCLHAMLQGNTRGSDQVNGITRS